MNPFGAWPRPENAHLTRDEQHGSERSERSHGPWRVGGRIELGARHYRARSPRREGVRARLCR